MVAKGFVLVLLHSLLRHGVRHSEVGPENEHFGTVGPSGKSDRKKKQHSAVRERKKSLKTKPFTGRWTRTEEKGDIEHSKEEKTFNQTESKMKPCSGRRVVFLLLHFSLPNRRPVFPPIQYGPNTFPRRCVYFVYPTKLPVCISWSKGKTNVWMRKGTSIKNGHTQIRKPALVSYSNVFVYGCVGSVLITPSFTSV